MKKQRKTDYVGNVILGIQVVFSFGFVLAIPLLALFLYAYKM